MAQLAPAEINLTRNSRGPRRREIARRTLTAAGNTGWREIVATMGSYLEASRWRNADLSVTLRGSLVRYLVLQWPGKLNDRDALAYAKQSFADLHGDTASGWVICVSRFANAGPRLAAAVDCELIEALRVQCAKLGLTLRSVRPALCAAVEDLAQVDAAYSGWLALIEDGHSCVARFQRGECTSVRTARFGDLAEPHLLSQLEQDAMCGGPGQAPGKLYIQASSPVDHGSLSAHGWLPAPLPARSLA